MNQVEQMYRDHFKDKLYRLEGVHTSHKMGELIFNTTFEAQAYRLLDGDHSVKEYFPHTVEFSFFNPEIEGTDHEFIDLRVIYKDGREVWIDIIPVALSEDEEVVARTEGAEIHAHKAGVEYKIWNEIDLFGETEGYMESLLAFFFGLRVV